MKKFPVLLAAMLAAAAAVIAAACGADDDGDETAQTADAPSGAIKVALVNWAVEPAQTSARAGKVTFWAVHDAGHSHEKSDGGVTHDLQVMKKLADGSFEMVGQVQGLKMGEAKGLTLDLAAGEYELACNLVEQLDGKIFAHYTLGMRTPFKVTA